MVLIWLMSIMVYSTKNVRIDWGKSLSADRLKDYSIETVRIDWVALMPPIALRFTHVPCLPIHLGMTPSGGSRAPLGRGEC
jgi:hypothetical protein